MKREDSEAECDVPVVGISHFLVVSEKFGSGKSLGIGIGKIWYRKKYRYRYQKYLVPEKSIGIGIVQHFGYRHTLTSDHIDDLIFLTMPFDPLSGRS